MKDESCHIARQSLVLKWHLQPLWSATRCIVPIFYVIYVFCCAKCDWKLKLSLFTALKMTMCIFIRHNLPAVRLETTGLISPNNERPWEEILTLIQCKSPRTSPAWHSLTRGSGTLSILTSKGAHWPAFCYCISQTTIVKRDFHQKFQFRGRWWVFQVSELSIRRSNFRGGEVFQVSQIQISYSVLVRSRSKIVHEKFQFGRGGGGILG